jgi:BirA family biotin operon repressor/biotin-[acetyl-CoA-carboxylase] ligase
MQHWLRVWREGEGFEAIRQAWLERAGPVGEPIAVNTGAGPVAGSFAGLDQTGALRLREPGGMERRFTFGDVSLLGAAGGEEE